MLQNTKQSIVFLMGPSASGKTDFAIQLANKFKISIISVDSALIYKGMDIGTAKPNNAILKQYPHHLLDICKPEESYSVFDFIRDAKQQIELAFKEGRIPVLVGGTCFYFHALEHGLSNLPKSSQSSKAKLQQLLKNKGVAVLHKNLTIIDPQAAQRIHPNDAQRIMRALEVFELSGKTLSELQSNKQHAINYTIKKIILMPERHELHRRVEMRFLSMMENGFLNEVKKLKKNPNLHENLPSIRCVGYRQAWQYLNGDIDKQEMIERAIIATRQLCKRQSTWLKNAKNALFLKENDIKTAIDFIENPSDKPKTRA